MATPEPTGCNRTDASSGIISERATPGAGCSKQRTVLRPSPGEVYATLLDEGRYLCSERSMYRILAEHQQVRERRDQRRHPCYQAPELIASRPNEVWSWDITNSMGPAKWTYFYLYVILDIFSRYVVGWMLAYRESAELAKKLIEQTIQAPHHRSGHSDGACGSRGAPMRSKVVAFFLAELEVTKTHRPAHMSPITIRILRASSRP